MLQLSAVLLVYAGGIAALAGLVSLLKPLRMPVYHFHEASDDGARRSFALYWLTIYPGSALIRRMWLQAVKRRAEAP